MKKYFYVLWKGCIIWTIIFILTGCRNKNEPATAPAATSVSEPTLSNSENTSAPPDEKSTDTGKETFQTTDTAHSQETDDISMKTTVATTDNYIIADIEPSHGLAFESNGDGTCSITGIGVCTDADIVIPEKSPEGDTVTLISKYALYNLENIDSITLLNYNYEIDKYAFQYSEFTTLNIIGGNPVFKESAFSSCEDLTSISFSNCTIEADEYAFFSCGKKATITFSNCTGSIDDYAFQYGDFSSLIINNCELEIGKSAFSSCDKLTSILFENSTIHADEYAFFDCGNSAIVEFANCSISLDERAFQYSSLESLTISGSKLV